MSIIVGGSAGRAVSASPFHAFDDVGASAVPIVLHPDGSMGATIPIFWGNILGGGHGWAGPGAAGPMSGIRARNSNGAGVGARTDILDWRLGQRFTTSNPSLLVVRQRKFTFECAVATNGNGPELGIKNDPNTLGTANTVLGYSLIAVGGIWGGLRRLVTGAGTAVVPVLQSFSTTVARRAKFVFTEGPNPLIECFMDGLLMFSLAGEANMPELSVNFAITYGPCVAATGGVTINTTAAEMRMDYL